MIEVICIDDLFSEQTRQLVPNLPIKNKIYSVRDIFATTRNMTGNFTAILLNEIHNPNIPHPNGLGSYEPSFNVNRFTTLLGAPIIKEEIIYEKNNS